MVIQIRYSKLISYGDASAVSRIVNAFKQSGSAIPLEAARANFSGPGLARPIGKIIYHLLSQPSPLEVSPLICRPVRKITFHLLARPGRWENPLSFASPARSVGKNHLSSALSLGSSLGSCIPLLQPF